MPATVTFVANVRNEGRGRRGDLPLRNQERRSIMTPGIAATPKENAGQEPSRVNWEMKPRPWVGFDYPQIRVCANIDREGNRPANEARANRAALAAPGQYTTL